MAKVTITIEDRPDGKVSFKCDPTFETMAKMVVSGEGTTSAHGYAMRAMRAVREESRDQAPTKIILPRVSRL